MRRLTLTACALAIALALPVSATAAPFTFSILPGSTIFGPPGGTIGWGYSIGNPSATDWLVLTGFDSDPFVHGTPTSLFDFPILAPLTTVTVPFDKLGGFGLLMLDWDAGAPIGFTSTGLFTLAGEFWSGDPLGSGSFHETADDQTADYAATVRGAPVPEPATVLLLIPGVAAILRRRAR